MKRTSWLIGGMILLLLTAYSANAFAQRQNSPKTIRVGCIDLENFIEKKKNGLTDGYGVAYLNEIAKYTNWHYEYVTGTWSECLRWLKEGKIDLLLPAEYSDERGKDFIFSKYSCCTDYAALYAAKDNDAIFFQDYASFDGMKIGRITNNHLNESIIYFAAQKGFQPLYVDYDNLKDMTAALAVGDIDAIVNGSLNTAPQQKLLAKFDFMPTYFMMEKSNTALMDELNQAMHEIFLMNPYFTAMLNEKYYGNLQIKGFTREEASYITRSAPILVVGNADNYPYEWFDAQSKIYKGIYPDILALIAKQSGLQFKIIRTNSIEESWALIKSDKADLIYGIYGNPLLKRDYNLSYTEPYFKKSYTLIGNRNVAFDAETSLTLALPPHCIALQAYVNEQYPNWTILSCNAMEECLEKVARHEADLTVIDSSDFKMTSILNQHPTLGIISTISIDLPVSLGIAANASPLLCSILDKAISRVTKKEIEQSILRNTFVMPPKITLYYYMQNYFLELCGIMLVLLLSLSIGIFLLYRERSKTRQNHFLTIKNSDLSNAVLLAKHADKARDFYDALYDNTQFGILQYQIDETTRRLTLLHANKGAQRMLDIHLKQGQYHCPALTEKVLQQIFNSAAHLSQDGDKIEFEDEVSVAGLSLWLNGTMELVLRKNEDKFIQTTFMDMTNRKNRENQMKQQSEIDALTGVFNKGTAEALCRAYLQTDHQHPAILFTLDLDNFKMANDSYGHQYGDQVLSKFAAAIRQIFGNSDIIGRIGGDEFIILMKEPADNDLLAAKAQEICRQAEKVSHKNNKSLVSCSIGIAIQTAQETSYDELFRKSDQALYKAKRAGKKGWCFS